MFRNPVAKVMWVGRATIFLVGLSVILAVIFGVASAALAGNGDAWRLGRGNVATKLTALGGKLGVNGSMLRLTNNNEGTDDTALELRVEPDEAPMEVNSLTRVDRLNVDLVDGKSAFEFVSNFTYRREYQPNNDGQGGPGELLSDGTRRIAMSCNTGDRLLSGGPASVNAASKVLDSYASDTHTWTARILPSSGGDNWTVVILCADQ